MNLDEIADSPLHFFARLAVRRDGGNNNDDAVTCEQFRNKADAADIGIAVLAAEAEAL